MKVKLHRKYNCSTHQCENIDGIEIQYGYYCLQSFCEARSSCKRRKGFRFHNFSVWLKRVFGFNLPIYFTNILQSNLSGTSLCPHSLPRQYDCWDCEFSRCDESCSNAQRSRDIDNGNYDFGDCFAFGDSKCKYFIVSDFGSNWDRETGEWKPR